MYYGRLFSNFADPIYTHLTPITDRSQKMNEMEIVGGIEALARDQIDTVAVGGISMVVGQSAVTGMRDRAMYLTGGLDDMDDKKLLGVIGMAQPLTFGTIEYDDGESEYVISRAAARKPPDDKLMESLAARLKMAPTKIIDTLVRDFGIDRPAFLAMGEFVTNMVEHINSCLTMRGKKPMDTIMIAPAIGELMPFVKPGLLEVSSVEDAAAKWPTSFVALVDTLENAAVTHKCIKSTPISIQLPADLPQYPTLSPDVIASITDSKDDKNSTRDYVAAIILRENKLTPHLVAIEEYNVQLAQTIQSYWRALSSFF